MSNTHIAHGNLVGAKLDGALIDGADLSWTGLTFVQLASTASFRSQNLRGVGLIGAQLAGGDFSRVDLRDANLSDSNLQNALFADAQISVARFDFSNLTKEQLVSTASYQQGDLAGVGLLGTDLTGVNFENQNISGAALTGISVEQLASSASYQIKSLGAVTFLGMQLVGVDLRGHDLNFATLNGNLMNSDFSQAKLIGSRWGESNLTNASFSGAYLNSALLNNCDLTNADFSGADLKDAVFKGAVVRGTRWDGADLRGAASALPRIHFNLAKNTISPEGFIHGVNLADTERLVIRDDDLNSPVYGARDPIPIQIMDGFAMDAGGVLELRFQADPWDSQISFEAGIPVTLGGTLELTFADGVDVAAQVGRTLRLFDWTGVAPIDRFNVRSPYLWDESKLYTTGELTLIAVPEPSVARVMIVGVMLLGAGCRTLRRLRRCQ